MEVTQSPKDQLIYEIRSRIQSVEARIKENESIISQNQLEVDRLQQRSISVSTQLTRLENEFDTVPRADIKVTYESVIDVRTRLVSMRSQLEKLQDAQSYLHEFKNLLDDILANIGGISLDRISAGGGESGGSSGSLGTEQIVRIVEAQEAERKRLANSLHDGPAQSLTNFILQAEIVQRLFDRNPSMASAELTNLKSSASVSFQKIRDFIFELRPMMLDDLGLIATVRRHTENYNQKQGNVVLDFHLTGPGDKRFPSHIEVMMFRAIQLMISNSVEQLNAKTVNVKLDVGEGRLLASIEDNGRYIDVETELDPREKESPLQNILEMRERIEMVGGTIEVFSQEGQGNSFEIMLPYVAQA
jgi:two-component system, NarL family, sensor histidine kinase DegS